MRKVVFMGTPDYATCILQELLTCSDFEVVLLVTQPDKPAGRGQSLTPPHIKQWVLENKISIDIYQPTSLKIQEAQERIAQAKADFIVVAAYGQILPLQILQLAPCINLHASLLPKYRGASPIQSAILHNETFSGVTAMLMQEGLDSGDMLGFSYVKLDPHVRVETLFATLAICAAKLTVKTLKNFHNIEALQQNKLAISYAKKIQKTDGLVDLSNEKACDIYTKFRAFDPWPGIFLSSGLKLKQIKPSHVKAKWSAGMIQEICPTSLQLTCKEGCLEIISVQPTSKKQMNSVDYARGKRLECGNPLV
ncbi:MAG: methionyl-tRNA formyltransferase [Sulfurospirillum sp.]|nr:methionyl-tRNA formyltransferase [Sulfurospirillum sp.]